MTSRPHRHVLKAASVAAGITLALSGCSGSDSGSDAKTAQGFPETLTLAAVPAENSADLKASYDPLIKLLEKETGAKVEFVQASDYAGVVEGMIADNVDLAFFGPFAYVVAGINGAKITPLGAVVGEKGEAPGYQSYGLAKSDNAAINGLEDFAGKKVCFVDPSSTSGFLYPSAGLIEEGVIKSGSEADISGRDDADLRRRSRRVGAWRQASGDCDAGFALDTMVDKTMIDKGDLKPGRAQDRVEVGDHRGFGLRGQRFARPEAIEKLKTIVHGEGQRRGARGRWLLRGRRLPDHRRARMGRRPAADSRLRGRSQGLRGHRLGEVQGLTVSATDLHNPGVAGDDLVVSVQERHKEVRRQRSPSTMSRVDVYRSEMVVLLGLSGSGKSTLLRCLNGLHPVTAGTVEVGGTRVDKASRAQIQGAAAQRRLRVPALQPRRPAELPGERADRRSWQAEVSRVTGR